MASVILGPAGIFNARPLLLLVFLGYADCAPAPNISNTESNHPSLGPVVYLVIIASLTLALVFLLAIKLHFVQARQSATNVKLKRLYLEPSSPFDDAAREGSSTITTVLINRSPFWLGFLGSPTKEIGFATRELLKRSEPPNKARYSGCPLSISATTSQCFRRWLQKVRSKSSPSSRARSQHPSGTAPLYNNSLTSSLAIASVPISCPSKAHLNSDQPPHIHRHGVFYRQLVGSAPPRGSQEGTSRLSLHPYAGSAESLHTETTFRNLDRRRSPFFDSCDVNAGSGFSTSKVKIEDSRCGSLQELGPVPGGSFLDHLELGSPMPLRFRLPSPLLSFRKTEVSHDPLVLPPPSTTFSKTDDLAHTNEDTVPLKSTTLLVDSPTQGVDKASIQEEKGRVNSYAHLGLGRPSQSLSSPSLAQCVDKDTDRKVSPLDAMLDQLVQATSEWDECVFVDDKFKSLIDGSRKGDKHPPLDHAEGASHREISLFSIYDLPEESEEENSTSFETSDPSPEPPYHILRDRTRDLLFPIPEEQAISVSDVVIQRY